jgi:hypothetical protein
MIKKFIDKLFGKSDPDTSESAKVKKSPFGTRHDIPSTEHGINPKLVDERAMDVVLTLKDGSRLELKSLPKFRETYEYVESKLSLKAQDRSGAIGSKA